MGLNRATDLNFIFFEIGIQTLSDRMKICALNANRRFRVESIIFRIVGRGLRPNDTSAAIRDANIPAKPNQIFVEIAVGLIRLSLNRL